MSSIGSARSAMRVFGLSGSGIDVDAMVEKLMTAAKEPYNKLDKETTKLGWKKETFNDFYTKIKDFSENKLTTFEKRSTLNAKKVTSNKEDIVTATANSDASNTTHSITVKQLATGVGMSSSGKITTGGSKTTLKEQFNLTDDVTAVDFYLNGKEIKLPINKQPSIMDLVDKINNSGAGVTAKYDTTQDMFFLYSNDTGSASGIDFSGTDGQGLNFLTSKLKLSAVSNINNSGVSTYNSIGRSATDSLEKAYNVAGNYASIPITPGKFSLKLSAGTAAANILVDTSTTSVKDIITQINNMKDLNGAQLATASIDANGKFSIKANNASQPISLTGSDTAAISFLQNQLGLSGIIDASTQITDTAMSSSSAIFFDQTAKLSNAFTENLGTFTLNFSDGTATGSVTVDYANESMQDIINKINNTVKDASGNQMAVASFENGKFTLKAKQSGAYLDLSGSDDTAKKFMNTRLNLVNQKGQDAIVRIDGTTMTQPNNNFTVTGVTYALQSIGTATVNVQTDTDAVIKSVKTFISDYNNLLKSLNTKVYEQYDSSYLPLTDDEKQAMKDTDVSLWTAKAKTGLLHNDSILRSLVEEMRNIMSDKVAGISGKYDNVGILGITINAGSSTDFANRGLLELSSDGEETLRTALAADPDALYKVFGAKATKEKDGSINNSKNGLAVRLVTRMKEAIDEISKEAGTTSSLTSDITSTLGQQGRELRLRMSAMSEKLQKQENAYYKKYGAMETALSKLSQQTTQLTSILGQ